MEDRIVVITGATGFLGSHIVERFLDAGYTVIALCRTSKATELKKRSDDPKFRVAVFDDLPHDDFSSVFQGVHAVVHAASPTPFYSNHVEVAVKGSLNIFAQAHAAGVKKFIFVSSIYSVFTHIDELLDPSRVFDDNSWGTAPEFLRNESAQYLKEFLPHKEDVRNNPLSNQNKTPFGRLYEFGKGLIHLTHSHRPSRTIEKRHEKGEIAKEPKEGPATSPEAIDPFLAYAASKMLAEEAIWSISDAYQGVDVISILPAYFYGPLSKFHVIYEPTALSTNYILYGLFARPQASYPPESIPDHVVDVRDVANACVLAVSAEKPLSATPRRRILLSSGTFSWKEVASEIARTYPEIKDRVVDGGEPKEPWKKRGAARLDVSMASQLLGFNEYIPWKASVKDAVACLLETENQWNPQG